MKLLAIDTATEQCSVALRYGDSCILRCVQTARGHADMVLPMVQAVLAEAGLSLPQLDAIAFGRGPGAFTGVRIAIGVVQGLAYACELPVVGISNLAAVAQQAADQPGEILVCMDARMGEVYWGRFQCIDAGSHDKLVTALQNEQLSAPAQVVALNLQPAVCLGTGFRAYPLLREGFNALVHNQPTINGDALPCAREIALLAERDYRLGLAVDAAAARPVYLRDQVTQVSAR